MSDEVKKFGIQETKDLAKCGIELGEGFAVSLKDGKMSFSDLTNFFGAVYAAPAAISGISQVPAELKDLDEAEKAELVQFVCDEFSIPQADAEVKIEKGLKLGVAIAEYVASFIKK